MIHKTSDSETCAVDGLTYIFSYASKLRLCFKTDGAILALSAHLSKEQLQNVFHKVCAMTTRVTASEFIQMGVNPLCRDQDNLSCIDKALLNENGNKINIFLT